MWLTCKRLTGRYETSGRSGFKVWAGDPRPGDEPSGTTTCGYAASDGEEVLEPTTGARVERSAEEQMLCHLIATHRVPLADARAIVKG